MFAFGRAARLGLRMNEDQHRFLSLSGQLPARLTAEQAAWTINCQPHDIPALITARLLKPLGNPAKNGSKFFCTADIVDLLKNRCWLTKVTNTINQHWHKQNSKKRIHSVNSSQNGHSTLLVLPAASAAR